MKIQVFVDSDYRVYNSEEVDGYVQGIIEDSDKEMLENFIKYIDARDNLNPLFRALYNCDSEAFSKICLQFEIFLSNYRGDYISENFHESTIEI